MRVWPEALGSKALAPTAEASPLLEYHEPSTEDLVERCASTAARWGAEKVASVAEPVLLFKNPDAHPLVLMLLVLDRYGAESMDWDPEVLRATLLRDNIQVSGANWTKILASRVLLYSPSPWRQWEVFHWVARALAGLAPNFTFLEEPELGHLIVCADVMKICDPTRPTSTEVDKYVAASLRYEGSVFAPASLAFAQRALEEPKLSCSSCGAVFPDDTDIKCISCGATTLSKVPYPHAALRDECVALWAKSMSVPIEQAFDALPESPAGNLVHDLLFHWAYALRIRKALGAQLRALAR